MHAAVLIHRVVPGTDPDEARQCALSAERLAGALQRALPRGWRVFAGFDDGCGAMVMRADEAIRAAVELSPRRLVVVSMDPWRGCGADLELPEWAEVRESWGDEASLIDLHARSVQAAAAEQGLSPGNAILVLRAGGTRWRGRRRHFIRGHVLRVGGRQWSGW